MCIGKERKTVEENQLVCKNAVGVGNIKQKQLVLNIAFCDRDGVIAEIIV
jgi:hypothetical protein